MKSIFFAKANPTHNIKTIKRMMKLEWHVALTIVWNISGITWTKHDDFENVLYCEEENRN